MQNRNEAERGITETSDRVLNALYRLLDSLLLKNPERTAVGGMLGLSIYGLIEFVRPGFAKQGISFGFVDWWIALCFGIVIVHLPFIIWSVRKRPLISDELENLILLIESTNIGEVEKRSAYRRVVNKCIEQFSISDDTSQIKQILQEETQQPVETAEP